MRVILSKFSQVHYTGTLEDGTKFDSSVDRGDKFSFTLGRGEVIKGMFCRYQEYHRESFQSEAGFFPHDFFDLYIGWDIGVASMARGELAIYTISSEYAYGSTGSPPKIPGGATLIFEIEVSTTIRSII